MSVYRLPEREELAAFLAARGFELPSEVRALGDGVSNTNLHLVTDRGPLVLTLYEHFPAEQIAPVLAWQQGLQAAGFPCPDLRTDGDSALLGELAGRPAALFEYIEDDGRSLPPPRAVGELLGRLHRIGSSRKLDIDLQRANPRGGEWLFATAESLLPRLGAGDRDLLQQELDYLARHSRLQLPSGAIHGDVFPDNLRVVDGRIRGLIDFEFACREVLLFDVAVAINAFCSRRDGRLDRLAMRDLLAAYNALRPLGHDENLAIPMMLRATALRFWLSRLEESMQETDEGVLRKPADEFRSILLHRREPLSGMQ